MKNNVPIHATTRTDNKMIKDTYILTKDFNWFGKRIPKGTLYVQYNSDKDKYRCVSEGNEKPHFDLTFYTLNAPWASEYFAKVNDL